MQFKVFFNSSVKRKSACFRKLAECKKRDRQINRRLVGELKGIFAVACSIQQNDTHSFLTKICVRAIFKHTFFQSCYGL